MSQAHRLKLLQETGKTVFSAKFLKQIWELSDANFKIVVKRMVDEGLLLRLAKGIYAISENYSVYELANTLVTPSYISFNSALFYQGVSFQTAREITSAANFNYQREIDGRVYVYYKIKKSLLYDSEGLIFQKNFTLATTERAILDCLYVGVSPNIDNPDKVNRDRLKILAERYPLRVQKQIKPILTIL